MFPLKGSPICHYNIKLGEFLILKDGKKSYRKLKMFFGFQKYISDQSMYHFYDVSNECNPNLKQKLLWRCISKYFQQIC